MWQFSTITKIQRANANIWWNDGCIKQRLAVDLQIICSNAGKQFFTCKLKRKTLGKVIKISKRVQKIVDS